MALADSNAIGPTLKSGPHWTPARSTEEKRSEAAKGRKKNSFPVLAGARRILEYRSSSLEMGSKCFTVLNSKELAGAAAVCI